MIGGCKEWVYHSGSFTRFSCSRKAVLDGFCTQHHPETTKTRRLAANAKALVEWDAKWNRRVCRMGFHDFWCQVAIYALLRCMEHDRGTTIDLNEREL